MENQGNINKYRTIHTWHLTVLAEIGERYFILKIYGLHDGSKYEKVDDKSWTICKVKTY